MIAQCILHSWQSMCNMNAPTVCTICLASDVKMYNLDQCGLANVYRETIGDTLLNDELPRDICFICKYKLCKLNEFKTICLRTYYNMCDLYMTCGKLTQKSIESLKKNIAVNSLVLTPIESISNRADSDVRVKDEFINNEESDHFIEIHSWRPTGVPYRKSKVVGDLLTIQQEDRVNTEPAPKLSDIGGVKLETVNDNMVADAMDSDGAGGVTVESECPTAVVKTKPRRLRIRKKRKSKAEERKSKAEERRSKAEERKPDKEELLICPECGVQCTTPASFAGHKRWQHPGLTVNNYQYKCSFCHLTFRYKTKRVYHERIHTDEKPFICEVCAKRFTASHSLVHHMRTHTGERPYPCDKCGKSFALKGGLRRHMLIHTGHKPFKCPQCDRRFNQSNSVKTHIHTVHMKLPTPYVSKRRRRQRVEVPILDA